MALGQSCNNTDPVLLNAATDHFGFGRANDATDVLDYSTMINGGFVPGLTLVGGTSAATATIVDVKDNGGNAGSLYLKDVVGVFQAGEALKTIGTQRGTEVGVLYGASDADAVGTQARVCFSLADPNGVLKAPLGSLCLTGASGKAYVNKDGGTTWGIITSA